jgi:glycosyltransferase involved in cell wall biosynthesis
MIKKDLKVALVHDSLVQYGGAEKTLKVLADMFPESPIYTSIYDKEKFQSHFSANRIRTSRLQNFPGFIKKRYKFLLPFLPTVFEEFDFTDFDLVISSSSSFAKGIVLPVHALHINYCHTPTRFLWDSTHTYLKAQRLIFPFNLIARGLLHKTRIWDRAAAERVDHFIANSKNTARRISKYYRKDSVIIHPPIEVKKTQMKSEHADFFLIVSRLEKYKHIDIAVKAFNQLPKRKLIIIGDGSQKNKLQQIARDNIQFLGYKNDEVTREYYKNCRAFIATSKDEDFGMTPLEAMAAGKPILAL